MDACSPLLGKQRGEPGKPLCVERIGMGECSPLLSEERGKGVRWPFVRVHNRSRHSLPQVFDQVVGVLDADADTNQVLGDPHGAPLGFGD